MLSYILTTVVVRSCRGSASKTMNESIWQSTCSYLSHLCIPSLVLVHGGCGIAIYLRKFRESSEVSAVVLGLIILFRSRKEGLGQIRVRCASLAVKHSEHHNRFHFPNALQARWAESFFNREERQQNDSMSRRISGRMSTLFLPRVFWCSFVVLDLEGFETLSASGRRYYSPSVPGQIWS
jgi:hypothetical protein